MDGEIRPDALADLLDGGAHSTDGDAHSTDGADAPEVDDGDPLVVDIRDPGVYRRGHIPESVNLPLSELVGGVDQVADADRVVTVCPHGKASVKAARLIAASAAFDGRVESLAGGLSAWDGPLVGDEAPDGASGTDEADAGGAPDAPF